MVVSLSASAKEEIQRKLDVVVQSKGAPGLVFGVTTSKEELFWAQSGIREVDNPDGGPITPDSVLWLCSQTKMVTSIAAFQVIEAGQLTLDTPAEDILPELANPVIFDEATGEHHPAKNKILIRHLLNHTSGSFYGNELKKGLLPPGLLSTNEAINNSKSKEEAIKEWFKVLRGDLPGFPLHFEPGTSWEYGYSTDLLGFIVEAVTKQSLEDVCKMKIFEPLGISSASFYLTPELEKNYVTLAVKFFGQEETAAYNGQFPIMERDPKKVRLNLGGVGLFATSRDFLTLERHLLQILDGTAEKPILKAETLKLFFEPSLSPESAQGMDNFLSMFLPPGNQHGLGLGLQAIDKGPDRRKKGSGWWSGWAGTMHYLDPQTGIAVYGACQLVPLPQIPVSTLWEEIEPILYKGLN